MTFISQTTTLNQAPIPMPLSTLVDATATMVRRFIDRQVMKASLEKLSEKELRDIGLIRNDVSCIDQMPLSSNGALELSNIGKSRFCNW